MLKQETFDPTVAMDGMDGRIFFLRSVAARTIVNGWETDKTRVKRLM